MAAKHPEIRNELNAIEDALAIYAKQNAVAMPNGLGTKILNNIDRLKRLDATAKVTQMSARGLITLLGIAASLFAITSIYFFNQNNDLKNQMRQSQIAFDSLQTNCTQTQARLVKLEKYLDISTDRNFKPIIMKGESLEKAPQAVASVFYNQEAQTAYLEIENLPEPPSNKQYQLWAIVDGVPQSMDVFDVVIGYEGLLEVPFYANAQAFAVTLEPKGGKATPTMEEMYVIGTTG